MLDSGAKCIHCTALLTIGRMLVVFAALDHLLPDAMEDKL